MYVCTVCRGLLPDPNPTGPEILSGFRVGFGLMFNEYLQARVGLGFVAKLKLYAVGYVAFIDARTHTL